MGAVPVRGCTFRMDVHLAGDLARGKARHGHREERGLVQDPLPLPSLPVHQ